MSQFSSLDQTVAAALQDRLQRHLYRHRRLLESAQGPSIRVDGKNYIGFCSNDYLGLANHPEVVAALQQAASTWGVGSGASHLVNGHSTEHQALEEELAAFCGRERALLFSTGYMANLGTVTALLGRTDAVFEDRLNHASLLDAGLLSGARLQRFQHNDLEDLERRLVSSQAERKLIAVDGIFSMDGDAAPLPELARLAERHKAWLMVDDAHGFGCLGPTGAGSAELQGLNQQQLPVLMGTLGKSLGTFGAFVAGSETLIETLIQYARSYIYTTALPPSVAAATRVSLRLLQEEGWRRERLARLITDFRAGAHALGLKLMPSETAIQPLIVGDEARALTLAEQLAERGLLVIAIRPPTVPVGSARLRITLSAEHSREQIAQLLEALADLTQGAADE